MVHWNNENFFLTNSPFSNSFVFAFSMISKNVTLFKNCFYFVCNAKKMNTDCCRYKQARQGTTSRYNHFAHFHKKSSIYFYVYPMEILFSLREWVQSAALLKSLNECHCFCCFIVVVAFTCFSNFTLSFKLITFRSFVRPTCVQSPICRRNDFSLETHFMK